MWRNTDVQPLIDWLRDHNAGIEAMDERAGFHGLDIYNMSGSIAAVLDYLDQVDPEAAAVARRGELNLRDAHMFETLDHLLDAGGKDAKAIVWAHNSHIATPATPTWA